MRRINVYAERCAGCRQCEMVCSFHHTEKFSPQLSRVTVQKDDRNGLDYPVMCRQCSECPPQDICPVHAITRNQNNATWVDWQTCTQCGACVSECTYNAIKLNHQGNPIICDLCDGKPQCVERCPTQALEYMESPIFTEHPEEAFNRLKKEWGFNG